MSLGEQFLPSAAMLEKLHLALHVLRSQPNRWFSLIALDREVGHGALISRFPLPWRKHVMQACQDTSSTIRCRYVTHHHHHHNSANASISSPPPSGTNQNNSLSDAHRFELQFVAPEFRSPKDMMKQLRYVNTRRHTVASSSTGGGGAGGGGGGSGVMRSNGGTGGGGAGSSSTVAAGAAAATARGFAMSSLAMGASRPTSLITVQNAVDKDWCYAVLAQQPPASKALRQTTTAADGNKASSGAPAAVGRNAGTRRPRGGGGGGGAGSSTAIAASGMQQTSVGGRGMCANLFERHGIQCQVATRFHGVNVKYPEGLFLPNVLHMSSSSSSVGPTGGATAAAGGGPSVPPNSAAVVNSGGATSAPPADMSDVWEIHVSRSAAAAAARRGEQLRITVHCEPASAVQFAPAQLIVPSFNPSTDSTSSNNDWRGVFRMKPVRECRAEIRLTVSSVVQQAPRSASSAATTTTTQQEHYSSPIQIKKRFPVDDATLLRAPPVLYFRGIGTTTVLSALGMQDIRTTTATATTGAGKGAGAGGGTTAAAVSTNRSVVAESVRRMLEPVPIIMESAVAGCVLRPSSEDVLKGAATALFGDQLQQQLSQFGTSGLAFEIEREHERRHQRALAERDMSKRKSAKKDSKKLKQRSQQKQDENDPDAKRKQQQQQQKKKHRDLKFCNSHMLHLGVDTRKPFQLNRGTLDTPLEPML